MNADRTCLCIRVFQLELRRTWEWTGGTYTDLLLIDMVM